MSCLWRGVKYRPHCLSSCHRIVWHYIWSFGVGHPV